MSGGAPRGAAHRTLDVLALVAEARAGVHTGTSGAEARDQQQEACMSLPAIPRSKARRNGRLGYVRCCRSAFALSVMMLVLVVPPAEADIGDLSPRGCVRDAEVPAAGCSSAQGLRGPYGVALSADGRSVYVASAFDDALAAFERDPLIGSLLWQRCLRDADRVATGCTGAQGLKGAQAVAVSADGTSVYVASPSDDAVAIFDRDSATGSLAWDGCLRDADVPADGCHGVQGLDGVKAVEVSADGRSVYAASPVESAVAIFDRDPGTGSLFWDGCLRDADRPAAGCYNAGVQGLAGASAVTVSADGESVYVASGGGAVAAFDRSTANGSLFWDGCARDADVPAAGCASAQGLSGAGDVAVSGDGRSVYVASRDEDGVAIFDRDPGSGSLAWDGCLRDADVPAAGCTGAQGLDQPTAVAVSVDGRSVYVASFDDNAVAILDRDPGTGSLAWDGCLRDAEDVAEGCTRAQGLSGASDVAVSADGRSVYIASPDDDALAIFDRELVSAARLSTTAVAFPDQPARTASPTREVALSNSGERSTLAVRSVALAGPEATSFQLVSDGCSGRTLANGQSCTVAVRFAPGTAGPMAARLRFSDDAPGSPREVALTGRALAPAADRTAPVIRSLSLTNRRFRVGPRPRGGSRLVRSGTQFRFELSEPARVSFAIERKTSGRRVGGRCRAQTRRNRGARRCIRYTRAGSFTRQLAAGRRRVAFSGRLRGRPLPRARYRAVLEAKDAANNRSRKYTATFRVVR